MPAVVSDIPVLLPFRCYSGFQDPHDEQLGHRKVVINVCILGGLFCELIRALVAKSVLVR